jgi:hypothetical protein
VRLLLLGTLAALGILLVFGVVDDRTDIDDTDGSFDRAIFWRVVGLAFLISALASATFVAVSALVDYLDRAAAYFVRPSRTDMSAGLMGAYVGVSGWCTTRFRGRRLGHRRWPRS